MSDLPQESKLAPDGGLRSTDLLGFVPEAPCHWNNSESAAWIAGWEAGWETALPSKKTPSVLDACCGSRMFWFDKADPRALFVDKRRETLTDHTGPKPASIVVNPDVLANFKSLPFDDCTFPLVVFDPPHTWCGPNGRTIKKYGSLPLDWRNEIAAGFRECFRVLCPLGTLVCKWNEHRVKLATVLSLTDQKPLFGQRVGNTRTHWIVFQKPND